MARRREPLFPSMPAPLKRPDEEARQIADREFEQAFDDFERELGVTLTLHDLSGVFRDPDGRPVLGRYYHRHPVCQAVHDGRCIRHCARGVNAKARDRAAPFTHVCWKGVQEIVTPIVRDRAHVATLFAGTFSSPAFWAKKRHRPMGVPEEIVQQCRALLTLDRERAKRLGRLLKVFADGLLLRLDRLHRPVSGDLEANRRAVIRQYLHFNMQEQITIKTLAIALRLSPSRASHVVREHFGVSFRTLLHRERLARARTLLLSSNATVAEIGRLVGMNNEYHFNRAFRAMHEVPPGQYRGRRRVSGAAEAGGGME